LFLRVYRSKLLDTEIGSGRNWKYQRTGIIIIIIIIITIISKMIISATSYDAKKKYLPISREESSSCVLNLVDDEKE